jgi:hypothetical protein
MTKGKYAKKRERRAKAEAMALESNEEPKETKSKKSDTETKLSEQPRYWGLTRFELIISILTLLAAGIAALTGRILSKQVTESELDSRAWVTAGKNGQLQAVATKALALPIRATNIGKTPAKNVVGRYYLEVVKNGEAPDFDYMIKRPLDRLIAGDLSPNENADTIAMRYRAKPGSDTDTLLYPLDDLEYKAIMDGSYYVAVHGIVNYDDVFHIHHWQTFCIWFPLTSLDYSTGACVAHNTSDDHGEPYKPPPKPAPAR